MSSSTLSARMDSRSHIACARCASAVDAPIIVVEKAQRQSHTIRVADPHHPKRLARPSDVSGYQLYRKMGGAAPASPGQCEYLGLFRRSRVVVPLAGSGDGEVAWYIAVPVDGRLRRGLPSEAVAAAIAA